MSGSSNSTSISSSGDNILNYNNSSPNGTLNNNNNSNNNNNTNNVTNTGLRDDLKILFESGEGSDFQLQLNQELFPVHR